MTFLTSLRLAGRKSKSLKKAGNVLTLSDATPVTNKQDAILTVEDDHVFHFCRLDEFVTDLQTASLKPCLVMSDSELRNVSPEDSDMFYTSLSYVTLNKLARTRIRGVLRIVVELKNGLIYMNP